MNKYKSIFRVKCLLIQQIQIKEYILENKHQNMSPKNLDKQNLTGKEY